MRALLCLMLILSVGCSSLSQKVFTQLKVGDSQAKMTSILGVPDLFQPSALYPGGMAVVYKEKTMSCGISIVDDKIKDYSCRSRASIQDSTSLLARVFQD